MRELAGMTLTDVATSADIAVAYLSKVELGQKEPSRTYVAKVLTVIAAHLRDAA
jgi:transcriptional regulator with XRE-family HTH domain